MQKKMNLTVHKIDFVNMSLKQNHLNLLQLMRLGKAVLGKTLFGAIMKQSFYGHFVAGEDRQVIHPGLYICII